MNPSDLKAWREGMNLTQAQAAELLGVHRQRYNEWEAGKVGIRGLPPTLGLACTAIWHRLEPWKPIP